MAVSRGEDKNSQYKNKTFLVTATKSAQVDQPEGKSYETVLRLKTKSLLKLDKKGEESRCLNDSKISSGLIDVFAGNLKNSIPSEWEGNKISLVDLTSIFDKNGNFKKLHELKLESKISIPMKQYINVVQAETRSILFSDEELQDWLVEYLGKDKIDKLNKERFKGALLNAVALLYGDILTRKFENPVQGAFIEKIILHQTRVSLDLSANIVFLEEKLKDIQESKNLPIGSEQMNRLILAGKNKLNQLKKDMCIDSGPPFFLIHLAEKILNDDFEKKTDKFKSDINELFKNVFNKYSEGDSLKLEWDSEGDFTEESVLRKYNDIAKIPSKHMITDDDDKMERQAATILENQRKGISNQINLPDLNARVSPGFFARQWRDFKNFCTRPWKLNDWLKVAFVVTLIAVAATGVGLAVIGALGLKGVAAVALTSAVEAAGTWIATQLVSAGVPIVIAKLSLWGHYGLCAGAYLVGSVVMGGLKNLIDRAVNKFKGSNVKSVEAPPAVAAGQALRDSKAEVPGKTLDNTKSMVFDNTFVVTATLIPDPQVPSLAQDKEPPSIEAALTQATPRPLAASSTQAEPVQSTPPPLEEVKVSEYKDSGTSTAAAARALRDPMNRDVDAHGVPPNVDSTLRIDLPPKPLASLPKQHLGMSPSGAGDVTRPPGLPTLVRAISGVEPPRRTSVSSEASAPKPNVGNQQLTEGEGESVATPKSKKPDSPRNQ